jgi:hypothetical protein
MEIQEIKVCVRPYYHDVVDTIKRKPKFSKREEKHYVTYKGKDYSLVKNEGGFIIWVEEQ